MSENQPPFLESHRSISSKPYWLILVAIGLFLIWVLVPTLISWWITHLGYRPKDPNNILSSMGTFGDTFGSINALFSAFAFLGVLYTIHQQHQAIKQQSVAIEHQSTSIEQQTESLEQQNQAIRLQTESIKQQNILIEQQNSALEIQKNSLSIQERYSYEQNFLAGFFPLFKNYEDLIMKYDYRTFWPAESSANHEKGPEALYETLSKLVGLLISGSFNRKNYNREKFPSILMLKHPAYFSRIFYSLRAVIDYLDGCEHADMKQKYAKIFRYSLSSQELWFIAYMSTDESFYDFYTKVVVNLRLLDELYYSESSSDEFVFIKSVVESRGIRFSIVD